MKKVTIGKEKWAFSGGNIPLNSTGREPEFVSSDRLSILNNSDKDADIKITLFFSDKDPGGIFKINVKPERVRKFRINDLIDPHAIPFGVPYAGIVESNVPVVVQFTKHNTSQKELALMGTSAYFE